MTVTRTNPRAALAAAVALVRGNPAAVAELDAAEHAAAAAKLAEAKRREDIATKIEKEIPARAAALVADYLAVQQAAIAAAAESVARSQLEIEYGAVPLKVAAYSPAPARLGRAHVEHAWGRLVASTPIPWDRAKRSAERLRSDVARTAAEELERPAREARELEARQRAEAAAEQERQRVAAVNARKAAIASRKAGKP